MMFPMNQFCFPIGIEPGQRNRFTHEEDEKLRQLVAYRDPPNWNEIAKYMRNRTPRQCRERYNNYLRPELVNGPWTKEEDDLLNDLFSKYGPKWSYIAQHFKSRSAVNVKNHHSSIVSQMSVKDRSTRFGEIQSSQTINEPSQLLQNTDKPESDIFHIENTPSEIENPIPFENPISIDPSIDSPVSTPTEDVPPVENVEPFGDHTFDDSSEKENASQENDLESVFNAFQFEEEQLWSIPISTGDTMFSLF